MKFLREYFYGGLDWHDSYSICNTLFRNGKVCNNEDDYIEVIAESFNFLNNLFIISKEEFMEILKSVHNKTKEQVEIPLYTIKDSTILDDGDSKIIESYYENNGKKYYETYLNVYIEKDDYVTVEYGAFYGQICYYYHFEEVEIADDDIAYLVCESFHAPTKGVPCVERMYTDLFDNLNDAEKYRKELDVKIHESNLDPESITSESTLNIVSRSEILLGDFYKLNMQAIELMKQKNVNRNDKSFQIFVNSHLEKLAEL